MTIKHEDFAKLELRVGRILSAARLEAAEKLLRLEVDIGERDGAGAAKARVLVAGIAHEYQPEELAGKTVVVLANIEPRKVRGVDSNGMVLAAVGEDGKAILLTADREAPVGAKVF